VRAALQQGSLQLTSLRSEHIQYNTNGFLQICCLMSDRFQLSVGEIIGGHGGGYRNRQKQRGNLHCIALQYFPVPSSQSWTFDP
jgi:hypothetical protein